MRRLSSFFLLTFVATALLAMFALPSFAADGPAEPAETTEHAEDGEHADEAKDEKHDDESMWLGMQAALAAGVVMGFIGFFTAGTEGLDGHGDHH